MPMFGPGAFKRLRDQLRNGLGGGSAPVVAGTSPTTFALAPSVQYHPHSQAGSVTKGGDSRILTCPDMKGLAAASATAGNGPLEMTDQLGRKFWRFNAAQWLTVAATLANVASQGVGLIATVRMHNAGSGSIFSLGVNGVAPANTGRAIAGQYNATSFAPFLHGGNRIGNGFANSKNMVLGSQLQAIGVFGRTAGTGSTRLFVNNEFVDTSSVITSGTASGAEIGRYAFSGGTYGSFDLYEIAIFGAIVSNTDAVAAMAATVTNWNIPALVNSAILTGDSITFGIGLTDTALCMSMVLSEPGQALAFPSGWRVINDGVSGNTVASLVARRDTVSSVYDQALQLAGRNVMFVQIGRNDFTASGSSGDTTYTALVALLNTTTTGVLQRGFEVRTAINIASGSAFSAAITQMRLRMRDPAFLVDTLTDTGNTFAGKIKRIELPLITSGASGTVFDTVADGSDVLWYQGDNTHPTAAGARAMALGADTPQYGYLAAL